MWMNFFRPHVSRNHTRRLADAVAEGRRIHTIQRRIAAQSLAVHCAGACIAESKPHVNRTYRPGGNGDIGTPWNPECPRGGFIRRNAALTRAAPHLPEAPIATVETLRAVVARVHPRLRSAVVVRADRLCWSILSAPSAMGCRSDRQ